MSRAVDLRFLFYNAFLLRVGRIPGPGGARHLHAVPAVDARAEELGRRLAGRYDIAALCEVFDERERAEIIGDRSGAVRPSATTGPPDPPTRFPLAKSSGLFTVVDGHCLTRTATHTYRSRGSRFLDSDAWAHKGALLAEVDLGLSANLEIYSTHLIWGGDLVWRRDRRYRSAVADTRQAQANELLDFVRRTHTPGNATLIAGDFNIDALDGSPAYGELAAAFDDAGFDDLWVVHGGGPGYTCDARLLREAIVAVDPTDPDLCAEPGPLGVRAAKRIDFAWLRRPSEGDGFAVSVEAVRRVAFPRHAGAEDLDAMPYLSDHLGIQVELQLREVPATT